MGKIIRKEIELKAPVARVWKAVTDYREFGAWFRVHLDRPFVKDEVSTGHMTYPGYEHIRWEGLVTEMEPERLFAFRWAHIKEHAKERYSPDYSQAPKTLVEFRLEPTEAGTLLTITESGFESIPAEWREVSFLRNDGGWTQQTRNIENYVTQNA